jgi:subtilisin family serine protease
MRNYGATLLLLSLMFLANLANASYQPGEVLVKYKSSAVRTRSEMNLIYQGLGVRDVKRFGGIMKGFEKLTFDPSVNVELMVKKLSAQDIVAYAQPNYILRLLPQPKTELPEDSSTVLELCEMPGFSFLPGCVGHFADVKPPLSEAPAEVVPAKADPRNTELYGMRKIGADKAWAQYRGNRQMIVAVIDTGVDYNHEDLSFNMWRNPAPKNGDITGYDFVHGDGMPFDDQGHGTHTAGTIGAAGGNGVGVSGVNQFVSIMALKFISKAGSGTTEAAIDAIDYAVSHGAKVLSNSWGGQMDETNQALYDAIERARLKDVLFVAAAGNDGFDNDTDPRRSYPAAYDHANIISVAATDKDDDLTFFSNYGRKSTHVGAPGANIYSTVPGNRYRNSIGTSMACPHVAGAAALIWSKKPSLTAVQVKKILMDSVDQVPALEGKTVTGGRINVMKALQSME